VGVGRLKRDPGCTTHGFANHGKTHAAYKTDCVSWENDGYDIIFFYASLRNPGEHAASFNLRNLVLTARDGRTFGPVNVRSHALYPPDFLP
jgi:hypothetical protein